MDKKAPHKHCRESTERVTKEELRYTSLCPMKEGGYSF